MRRKTFLAIGAIAVFSFSALADDNGNNSSFQSSVVGSTPTQMIGGINSGGVAWVVKEGSASVSSSGRIQVEVKGLLLAATGTTPVTMVGASLVCGGSGGTVTFGTTDTVTPATLSSTGNAEIDQVVTLATACLAPAVLVRVFTPTAPLGSQLGVFIAATGLTPGAAQNQNAHGGGGH
jgi:hypothetical protein